MTISWYSRALITAGATVAVAVGGGGIASAHVTVSAPGAQQSGDSMLTFRVPNESATGSPTIALTVQFPGLDSAATAPIPGWKAAVAKDANDKVTSITWTADPGAGIGPEQFQQFPVWAEDLPDQPHLSFPAVQTYADGQVVRWDQQTQPGRAEPENPAPTVTLAPKGSDTADPATANPDDDTARLLGIGGLVAGVVGIAIAAGAVVALRRRS